MALRDEVLEKLYERVSVIFGKDPSELSEEMSLSGDLGAKSVNFSQITTFLEDEFDVEVPYMKFRRKDTLGATADYVVELCEE